ncbi:MgtC family-domain-containing protein [Tribonema minus]|uniref:MgtC family-domain-containing protein n=1 Tax=Tribonema minus TaxID=303371 RepID=A0A836C7R4_9STRA|nr:MgtC family-domain-containing protein [Tribonema minus]
MRGPHMARLSVCQMLSICTVCLMVIITRPRCGICLSMCQMLSACAVCCDGDAHQATMRRPHLARLSVCVRCSAFVPFALMVMIIRPRCGPCLSMCQMLSASPFAVMAMLIRPRCGARIWHVSPCVSDAQRLPRLPLWRCSSGHDAGLRTHILVCLGASLFTLSGAVSKNTNVDETRIAAQVVSGIGFLGAGAIVREGLWVRGLTTAAALWVTAAMGVALGLGAYASAGLTMALVMVTLAGLQQLEDRVFYTWRRRIVMLDLVPNQPPSAVVVPALKALGSAHVSAVTALANGAKRLRISSRLRLNENLPLLAETLMGIEGVAGVEILHA